MNMTWNEHERKLNEMKWTEMNWHDMQRMTEKNVKCKNS